MKVVDRQSAQAFISQDDSQSELFSVIVIVMDSCPCPG
jgi:hypothetical protein